MLWTNIKRSDLMTAPKRASVRLQSRREEELETQVQKGKLCAVMVVRRLRDRLGWTKSGGELLVSPTSAPASGRTSPKHPKWNLWNARRRETKAACA